MIDYARETVIDIYNALYELEDIYDADYGMAVEALGGDDSKLADNGNKNANPPANPAPAANNGEKNDQGENKADPNKPATSNDNKNLNNTAGFVSKLKALIDKIVKIVKEAIEKVSDRIQKMQERNMEEYFKKLEAKKANGINAIEIENYKYNPSVIGEVNAKSKAIITKLGTDVDSIFVAYKTEKGTGESSDTATRVKAWEKEDYEKLYTNIANAARFKNAAAATADNFLASYQDSFRGDKSKFTIDEEYAGKCEAFLRAANLARNIVDVLNTAKNLTKKLSLNTNDATAHPNTDKDVQDAITRFMTEAGKMITFITGTANMSIKLMVEAKINCQIVLNRAYSISDKKTEEESKDAEADTNTEENADTSDSTT